MKITQIYKRDGTLVPFNQLKITHAIYKAAQEAGGHDMKLAEKLSDMVVDILENHFPQTIPAVEEIQDIVEQVLIKEGHTKTSKLYILYRQKRKELREKREKNEIENIPYKTIWQNLVWNLEHSCDTVSKLNEHIEAGIFSQLIKDSEARYDQEILKIASLIKANLSRIKLLIISGPSSSGKTTTTQRIADELKKEGIDFVKLAIDNYFYSLDYQLKDDYSDYDFEGPYALDIPLINQHLADLLRGEEIDVPRYDFKSGCREEKTDKLKLKDNQIILIDSHFGIYDKLTEIVPDDKKYKLYLETLCQLKDNQGQFVRWTDIRLLRRMIRDVQFRSYNPKETIGHWHYVRQGELKNIIPYIHTADYVFNTSLAYELPILKHCLFKFFPEMIEAYKNDPNRQDAYIRAQRVYDLLKEVKEWPDKSLVPQNSILREFIGDN